MHTITKLFSPDKGYSCAFRNWHATSHCRFIHGYDLRFEVTFASDHLDSRGWVVDFGYFGEIKKALDYQYDHTLIVAEDDPKLLFLTALYENSIADVRTIPEVSIECFAVDFWYTCDRWLKGPDGPSKDRNVKCIKTTVYENGSNSASYTP